MPHRGADDGGVEAVGGEFVGRRAMCGEYQPTLRRGHFGVQPDEFFQLLLAFEIRHHGKHPLACLRFEILGHGDEDLGVRRDESRGRLAGHAHFLALQLQIQRLDLEGRGRGDCGLGFLRRSGCGFSSGCGCGSGKADRLGRFQDDLRAVLIKLDRAGDLHVLAVIGEQRLSIDRARFPHGGESVRRAARAEIHEGHAGCDRFHAGDLAGDGHLLGDVFARLGVRDGDGVERG